MYALKRRPRALALLLLLILQSVAPLAATSRGDAEGWIEVSGSHFTLFSNLGPRRAKQVAAELEALGGVLRRLLPGLRLEPVRPIHVFLFNKPDFLDKHEKHEKHDSLIVKNAEASYFALDGSAGTPRDDLYHQYTHHILTDNDPGIPLWLNEGLANYFETFAVVSGQARFAYPHRSWQFYLQFKSWMSLERLLQITARSEEYRDPDQNLFFDAQAWTLVHYLFDRDDERHPRTVRVLSLLAAGAPSTRALPEAYGKSLKQLQAAVRSANRLRRKYHWQSISVRDLDIRQDFTVRPLDRAESLCRLGELRLLWGDEHVAEADGYFDEALSLAPNGARALTGKATVRLGLGEPEEAIALLERAIHLEPSAHSYYLLGNALMQRFAAELRRGPARGEPTPPLVTRAREAYQKALQLDPRLLDAYDQVARTYVYDSESQQSGVELMEKVLARVPRVDLALTLIELHSRRGDREAARAVKDAHLARLVDAMSHRSVDEIDRALIRSDLVVVDAWGEEGRPRHALALARELEDKTDDRELRREIEKRILSLSP